MRDKQIIAKLQHRIKESRRVLTTILPHLDGDTYTVLAKNEIQYIKNIESELSEIESTPEKGEIIPTLCDYYKGMLCCNHPKFKGAMCNRHNKAPNNCPLRKKVTDHVTLSDEGQEAITKAS